MKIFIPFLSFGLNISLTSGTLFGRHPEKYAQDRPDATPYLVKSPIVQVNDGFFSYPPSLWKNIRRIFGDHDHEASRDRRYMIGHLNPNLDDQHTLPFLHDNKASSLDEYGFPSANDTERRIIWLQGEMGSGKTIVASKFALQQQRETDQLGGETLWFFFDERDESYRSPQQAVRDWLAKLLEGFEGVYELFGEDSFPQPDKQWEVFVEAAKRIRKLSIVLDGVPSHHGNFVHRISTLAGENDNVRVLFSSREESPSPEWTTINMRPTGIERWAAEQLGSGELGRIVKEKVGVSWLMARMLVEAAKLKGWTWVSGKSAETRVASLPGTLDEFYEAVVPADLESWTHGGNPHQESSEWSPEELTKIALTAIPLSGRPLSVVELWSLVSATKCYPTDRRCKSASSTAVSRKAEANFAFLRLLLEKNPVTNTVRVVHPSLTSFLKTRLTHISHELMAISLVHYLHQKDFKSVWDYELIPVSEHLSCTVDYAWRRREKLNQRFAEYPLLHYAANFWPHHLRSCGSDCSPAALSQVDYFLDVTSGYTLNGTVQDFSVNNLHSSRPPSLEFQNWLKVFWWEADGEIDAPHNFTAVHVAGYFGLEDYARHLAGLKVPIDIPDGDGSDMADRAYYRRTPLAWATLKNSNFSTAKFFLSQGANPLEPDYEGLGPFHHAASRGIEMIKAFLDARPDLSPLESRDCSYHIEYGMMGQGGLEARYEPLYNHDEETRELLLQHIREHPERAVGNSNTIFHWAAEKGRVDVIQDPLWRTLVDRKNDDGATPLMIAAAFLKVDAVEALLEVGAEVNLAIGKRESPCDPVWWMYQEEGNTALDIAGVSGSMRSWDDKHKAEEDEVRKLLLEAGAKYGRSVKDEL